MRREGEKSRHMKSPVETHVLAATTPFHFSASVYCIWSSVTGRVGECAGSTVYYGSTMVFPSYGKLRIGKPKEFLFLPCCWYLTLALDAQCN